MLACTASATLLGVRGHPVRVETHVHQGLPSFQIVGLPDASCRERATVVRAALQSTNLAFPMQRITVNLAPSGLRKAGTSLDLAVAMGLLAASRDDLTDAVAGTGFVAELGLDGSLRPPPGVVPLVLALRDVPGIRRVVVPTTALADAALVPGVDVHGAGDLAHVLGALTSARPWADRSIVSPAPEPPPPEIADVRGQPLAKRALEIAAAGGHHLFLVGPPGAGKTMLASRLAGLLPSLDDEAALEVTAIWSAAGEPMAGSLVRRAPFRAPHHSSTAVALVGGGTASLRPGEISLAHHGVLFLDEVGEFPTSVLDTLRQPIEEGVVRVSRARGSVTLPARFQLVAATNPCPCGRGGSSCSCSDAARQRYARRLSGPLLDRFDLRLEVDRPDAADLFGPGDGDTTAVVAERVSAARTRAADRNRSVCADVNAALPAGSLDALAPVSPGARRLLEAAMHAGTLSGRGMHRVRRVARTIADLADDAGPLHDGHIAAAMLFRAPTSHGRAGRAA